MQYRDFPKGDARRYFVVLAAINSMKRGEATTHRIAGATGCTRAEAQRAIQTLVVQFGLAFDRQGAAYVISSWGVLHKAAAIKLASTPPKHDEAS